MTVPDDQHSAPAPPPLDIGALPDSPTRSEQTGRLRRSKRLLGALLAIDLALLLAALSLAQVTAEGPAMRGLRHSVAILTEIDAFLDQRYDEIRAQAAADDQGSITLTDLPVAPTFSPAEVTETGRDEFRAILLDRMAKRVYDDGSGAFADGGSGSPGFFSSAGVVERGMDLLREDPHRIFTVLTIILSAIAALLTAALVSATRGFGRLAAVGFSVSIAAVAVLIPAIAVRFAFDLAADRADDYLAHEFLLLGRELTWASIRDSAIFAGAGLLALAAGATLALWSGRRAPQL